MSVLSFLSGILGGNRTKGSVFNDIRELIKGKEVDPNEALNLIQKVNEAEAHHRSIWVAGWRPAIGWTGATVIFYHYVLQPILIWVLTLNGITDHPPTLDLDALWPVVTGMLGIGTMRSVDKYNKKAS